MIHQIIQLVNIFDKNRDKRVVVREQITVMCAFSLLLHFASDAHEAASSPCSRAMEAERIARSRFSSVKAVSHSEIILVTEVGSPATVSDDPTATAA